MGMKLEGPSGGGSATGLVADAINDGVTTVAPSQNAVFDALALKADADMTGVMATTLMMMGG